MLAADRFFFRHFGYVHRDITARAIKPSNALTYRLVGSISQRPRASAFVDEPPGNIGTAAKTPMPYLGAAAEK
jgi:hypothetical protein